MMIKVVVQCPESLDKPVVLKGNLIITECIDIRDLVVRLQSDDYWTSKVALKRLLNILYEEDKNN